MKILYHHRTLSKDGQNVHIEELIAALRRAGHQVHVVGPSGHQGAAFGSDGGFLSRLRAALPAAVGEILEVVYSILAFYRLWRAYRDIRPDALYERYNLFLLAGAWLKRLTGISYALEVNAPLALERKRNSGLALDGLARRCERYVWRAADVVLPVTTVLARDVTAAGVSTDRIHVVPNGIDLRHFPRTLSGDAVRARHGLGDKIIIGFTGFIRDWHGLPAIVPVMRDLAARGHDVHFLVVGDGQARPTLEKAAADAGIGERLTFTGVVERAEIPSYVAAFDIAVQPKATAYASPLKLFEYMALARAILAPDQPNLREVLADDVNALLFTPDDAASLRIALTRLVVDADLRRRLGAAAAAVIQERDMTWDGNSRTVVRLLAALTARGAPARGDAPAASVAQTTADPL